MKKNKTDTVVLAMPCNKPCPKCGSVDIYRRFFRAGNDTMLGIGSKTNVLSSEWVDRHAMFHQPALKDVITHYCRCCGYGWDSDPLLTKGTPT